MPTTLDKLIDLAINEDIGPADITTEATIPPGLKGSGQIRAKQNLIVAGLEAAKKGFLKVDPSLVWKPQKKDGDFVEDGGLIAEVSGPIASLLTAERIVLNFLQHLSGIATSTQIFVQTLAKTETKILDTRKTTPGYRKLEKEAVKSGGGTNHRMGLYDNFLIKDNHISAAGSITEAIKRAKAKENKSATIEVETGNLDQVKEALDEGADIIMLDNFSLPMVKEAVKLIAGRSKIEVSGNIRLDNIKDYAIDGVDFISIGAITHSAPAADIHMIIS